MVARLLLPLGLIGLAVGCAPTPAMQTRYAQPNFAPPVIAAAPTPQPKPAASIASVRPAAPRVAATPKNIPSNWLPRSSPRKWDYIVIHHSATPGGSAAVFDRQHKAKGWDELGYHFVIDNGSGQPDGLVEVGTRWPVQKWGAHAKTPDNKYNETGIGICLVGNFDNTRPSAKQLASLGKLVSYLMATYHIPADHVIGHRETGKATDCPGNNLNVAAIRRNATQMLAGAAIDSPVEHANAGN